MGFKTTITRASTKTESLRTTVPAAIVHQFNLNEGDKLYWTLIAEKGEIAIVVKPEK